MRTTVRALATFAVVGALTAAGIGCGTGTPPPRATATPSASSPVTSPAAPPRGTPSAAASAVPTPPPTDPATVIAADGIGPYTVGALLTDLQGPGLVSAVIDSPTCIGSARGAATGRYAGIVALSFLSGRLVSVRTMSNTLVTPSGAKVGMSVAAAQTMYGSRATVVTSPSGAKAMVVRVTGSALALVLYLDQGGTGVTSIAGGEYDRLEAAARLGDSC